MRKDEIIAAIEKARKGIGQYLDIMTMLPTVDVSTNRAFQRRFNHFYRIKQRPEGWYAEYYSFMERGKRNPPYFEDVLDHLHFTLGRYEPSFSSKLAATLTPDEPVWDQYVIKNTGQKAPAYSSPRKFEEAKAVFQGVRKWYRERLESLEGRLIIELFKGLIDQHDQITDVKKIDFVLWQTRIFHDNARGHATTPGSSGGFILKSFRGAVACR
jgi:hypothetical protein